MFEIVHEHENARLGKLFGKIETPTALMYTRRGFPSPLTPKDLENLQSSFNGLIQISAPDLFDSPGLKVLGKVGPGGVKQFCGYGEIDVSIFISIRDALQHQCDLPASETWSTVQTSGGQKKLEVDEYISLLGFARPQFAESMADEVMGDASGKRLKKSVDRTLTWLDRLNPVPPDLHSDSVEPLVLEAREKGGISRDTFLLAPVVGGENIFERRRSARETVKRAADGYVLAGFGTSESPQTRNELVRAVVEELPRDKPRFIHGLLSLDEMLAAMEDGVDLFETAYPYLISCQGQALIFPVEYEEVMKSVPRNGQDLQTATFIRNQDKLNLWDTAYRNDTSPILSKCSCFTCQRHTRNYLHHLLNTHEMLADVLLSIHNTAHFMAFFKMSRQALSQNAISSFRKHFATARMT